MGKGFNNYMCKKFFHPASRDNLKRVWMAEQKAESYKKKQEELRVQYEKEQDLYTNKAILSKESKDKLSVNFMYEPPPGTKKEREREDDEPEYKFEWQRKFNAPREDYCKGDSEIRDQPFGIQVRNVRCIKCHKWGHINTDKECPMYNQASSSDHSGPSSDPLVLIQQMREDGLAMKKSALSLQQHINFPSNQRLLSSDDDDDNSNTKQSEVEFLKSLSVKQKRRLLRKLEELEKKDKSSKTGKKKKKKKKAKRKAKESEDSTDSSDTEKESHKAKKKKKKQKSREKKKRHTKVKREDSSSSSSSNEEQNGDRTLEEVLGRSIKFSGADGKMISIKQEPNSDDASHSRSSSHKLYSSGENKKLEKSRHEDRRKKNDRIHKDRSSEKHISKSRKRKSSESSGDTQRKRHRQ